MLFGLPENARIIHTNKLFAIAKIKIVILDDHSKVFLLSDSKNGIRQTPLFRLIPIGHNWIHSENLFYALQDDSLTIGVQAAANHVIKTELWS
jgi:thiamine pyrophosphokinase